MHGVQRGSLTRECPGEGSLGPPRARFPRTQLGSGRRCAACGSAHTLPRAPLLLALLGTFSVAPVPSCSLVYKAMQLPEYQPFLEEAIAAEKESHKGARPYAFIADRLAVTIGTELSKLVPGRVRSVC